MNVNVFAIICIMTPHYVLQLINRIRRRVYYLTIFFYIPAFTWFSVCEYILATANMAFHAVVVRDLPLHQLQVVCPTRTKTEQPLNRSRLVSIQCVIGRDFIGFNLLLLTEYILYWNFKNVKNIYRRHQTRHHDFML